MSKQYAKIGNFTVVAMHEGEKLMCFFIEDKNGDKLSSRTFTKASDAIEYGNQLMECKGLLNDKGNDKGKSK